MFRMFAALVVAVMMVSVADAGVHRHVVRVETQVEAPMPADTVVRYRLVNRVVRSPKIAVGRVVVTKSVSSSTCSCGCGQAGCNCGR